MKNSLIIGSIVCDIMIYVDSLPTTAGDVHVKEQWMSVGGCAFNVANILHRLDLPHTFISPVGTGIYGEFVKSELLKQGMTPEIMVEEANGCCYCFVEQSGERTFISHHGVEYTFYPDWLNHLDIDDFDYIYICGLEIEERDGPLIIDTLNNVKGTIIFCPGPRGTLIDSKRLEAVYGLNPIIHCNEEEIKALTNEQDLETAIIKMHNSTNNIVITTLGDKGACFYDGVFHYIEGVQAKVIDTIGAGDSHVGGVIAALTIGYDLSDAIRFGNHVSSKIVSRNGVNLNETDVNELRQLLQDS